MLRCFTIIFAVLFHAVIIGSLVIISLTGKQESPPLIKVVTLPVIVLPPAPPAGQPLGGDSKGSKKMGLKRTTLDLLLPYLKQL